MEKTQIKKTKVEKGDTTTPTKYIGLLGHTSKTYIPIN
jgi:hypothetical protein